MKMTTHNLSMVELATLCGRPLSDLDKDDSKEKHFLSLISENVNCHDCLVVMGKELIERCGGTDRLFEQPPLRLDGE